MIFRTICFEIPADDVERAKKFYSDLFGWKMEKWPGADGKDISSSNMEY
jgi:predicted enzyme related to lactoylglutathione lyase